MKKLTILLAAAVLSACSTYGSPITDDKISQIKQGSTTKDELLSRFGKPIAVAKNSDGTQIMSWGYAHVGFAGSSYKNQALSVVLDSSGKVMSYTTSETGNPY